MHHVFVSSFKKLAGGRHPRSGDVDALLSDVYNCTLKEADQKGKKPEGNRASSVRGRRRLWFEAAGEEDMNEVELVNNLAGGLIARYNLIKALHKTKRQLKKTVQKCVYGTSPSSKAVDKD